MQKKKLELIDTIFRKKKQENTSIWKSDKGSTYIFKHVESEPGKRKPVAQVYKDREYLTGLFRTKEHHKFSGDIKYPDGKQYLVFVLSGEKKISIYKRV